jgi:hypothetical protein
MAKSSLQERGINPKIFWIFLIIAVGFVILTIILNVVFYFEKMLWFKPYKAEPKGDDTNYYYPNGKPDATTGKPADTKTIPSGVTGRIKGNLTQYNAISGSTESGWGYYSTNYKPS